MPGLVKGSLLVLIKLNAVQKNELRQAICKASALITVFSGAYPFCDVVLKMYTYN